MPYLASMNKRPFFRLGSNLVAKMENYVRAEGLRMRDGDPDEVRLRLIKRRVTGIAIGIIVVILYALWVNHKF